MAQEESFLSHLVELRDRLVRSLLFVLVMFGICMSLRLPLIMFANLRNLGFLLNLDSTCQVIYNCILYDFESEQ